MNLKTNEMNVKEVSDESMENISIGTAITNALNDSSGKYINAKVVKEKGIKKITVLSVGKAYVKSFVDPINGESKPRTFIDLNVRVDNDCVMKGKELIFSLNRTNTKKMVELYTDKPENWTNKILRLTTISTQRGDSITIDSD